AVKARMRFSTHTRPLMEMAIVRMCQLDDLLPIGQIAQWLAKDGNAPPAKAVSAPAAMSSAAEKKKASPDPATAPVVSTLTLGEDSVDEVFQQLLSKAGFALQSDLRKVNLTAISGPNSLVFHVSRRYNAAGSLFNDPARLSKVEDTLGAIVGQPCK